ncbi:MAG: mutY [Nevskia sp.]|nr:mutY [Nevskia sp.]
MKGVVRKRFAQRLLDWFDQHGRHDLPWQHPRSAYRVWISEVMLQQTQVKTVVPYFERFMQRFPDVAALATAPLDDVLLLWAGLGYYARARNLHRAAQQMLAQHGGEVPQDFDALLQLPGLGRSTAGAILAQAHGARHAILDGNVKRVLARHAAIAEWPGHPNAAKQLWTIAESLLPQQRLADYTQAIMDFGASLCTQRAPACTRCPVNVDCRAFIRQDVARFPAPRPRRERPLRLASALLIENAEGEILLERRPPVGIWGGLWCPPLLEDGGDAATLLSERYGLRLLSAVALPRLRHAFTHFELELLPLRIRLDGAADTLRDCAGQRWVKLSDPLPALPAPVSKLLQRLKTSTDQPCPEPSTA